VCMTVITALLTQLRGVLQGLPDGRQPSPRLTYTMQDIGLAAFSVFFMQSPSFLSYQRIMQRLHGASNAATLFGLEKIPSDNQVRNVLDTIDVKDFLPLFRHCFTTFAATPHAEAFRYLYQIRN